MYSKYIYKVGSLEWTNKSVHKRVKWKNDYRLRSIEEVSLKLDTKPSTEKLQHILFNCLTVWQHLISSTLPRTLKMASLYYSDSSEHGLIKVICV